jgi:pimeloyl-ACP methyl ester carboxylesterase
MKKVLFAFVFCLGLSAQAALTNLVLVPGFFNSAIPAPDHFGNPWEQPYFSHDIVRQLSTLTTKLLVVDNLNPVGSVADNGTRLINFLKAHEQEFGGKPITLLAHSAGGLYSLYAAAYSDLPINQVITVSTPFRGMRLFAAIEEQGIPIETLTAPFCLKNLMGLREAAVQNFLSSLQFKHPLRLDVFGGYQPTGLAFWDWRVLSTPLVPFQALIKEPSDGIVTVDSALNPVGLASLVTRNRSTLNLQIHKEVLNLEHWEVILDAELTRLYGILNVGSLREAQKKIYTYILQQSGY